MLRWIACCLLCWPIWTRAQSMNDWEQPRMPSSGTVQPHAHYIPYPDLPSALEQKQSSRILSLDGNWKFNWVSTVEQRPADFFKPDFNTASWPFIKVPANWQTEGYDRYIFTDVEYPIKPDPPFVPKDFNPVGSYVKDFDLPANWNDQQVFLHFGAVNSFFYCWVNGHYLGFSKDSKTPAEFDISRYLKKGRNRVAVQVFRFSDGTYLEGQDMWKLSGIERSVLLIKRPAYYIRDFFVHASLDSLYQDGKLDLDLAMAGGRREPNSRLTVKLIDEAQGGKLIYEEQLQINHQDSAACHAILPGIRAWTAETPHLYTLVLLLESGTGKTKEALTQRIGFRTVEIKNGLFLVNGRAIKLKGVNRHEHDPVTGKVITVESMIRDIRIMKAYNINAVRNSHYPNRREWYELCNQYGLYLIDEANIECDGMSFHPLQTLSDHPDWSAAYLDRTRRMVEWDKNFTSIITWSLGNESRFGRNLAADYDWIKERDRSRPVQYEEARDNPYTDIICPMYKPLNVMLEYVRDWHPRPFIQCEYAHMMGNSGGNLADDWDLIYRYPQLQGGFVWDFSDQTFLRKDSKGREYGAYGSDMGMVGATSDTSFCADGLFTSDRKPHPQAFELKSVYQPVAFEAIPLSPSTIRIRNRYDFINLSGLLFHWSVKEEGRLIASGTLPVLHLSAGRDTLVELPLPLRQYIGDAYLQFEALARDDGSLFPAGHLVASAQFVIPGKQPPGSHDSARAKGLSGGALEQSVSAEKIAVYNSRYSYEWNKNSGWLSRIRYNGEEIMMGPLQPDCWRPPTDNDIGNSLQIRSAVWQHIADSAQLLQISVVPDGDNLKVHTRHQLSCVKAVYETDYLVQQNGRLHVSVKLITWGNNLPELPRFGMKLLVKKTFKKVNWFGRGPFDNYSDRKTAAHIDRYSLSADSIFHPYPRAQESGYRTDVHWMQMTNGQQSIRFSSDSLFCFGVLPFNRNRIEFNRSANIHGSTIDADDYYWINVDARQMGVGGDNAWGLRTHSEYTIPYQNYQYSFTISPE